MESNQTLTGRCRQFLIKFRHFAGEKNELDSLFSRFDTTSCIETLLFRYELWEANEISRVEVEDYHVRHYEPLEIEHLLDQHELKVIGKWQAEPHSRKEASDADEVFLYECVKSSEE